MGMNMRGGQHFGEEIGDPKIFVDDPKGVFVLRWYKELNRNGDELTGYQNKSCKFYKLSNSKQ